ncbi:uncharacterized protein KY384_007416 [Bacidia gigantensis]|uniref:uncharacterized protein n=1 Tax=Bacidia gigantensis TaxID=2732470 RepID=UPI001D059B5B|nr:uncharacterized protein KY384_007416 [Bacidia gigantensis]KAG8528498.1 hypothetical protein KY384_007416 [Bacidia gigantensis]
MSDQPEISAQSPSPAIQAATPVKEPVATSKAVKQFVKFKRDDLSARGASMFWRDDPQSKWIRLENSVFGPVKKRDAEYNVEDVLINGEHIEIRQWGLEYERGQSDKHVQKDQTPKYCWCVKFKHHAIKDRIVYESDIAKSHDVELQFTCVDVPISEEVTLQPVKTLNDLIEETEALEGGMEGVGETPVEDRVHENEEVDEAFELLTHPERYPLARLFENASSSKGKQIKLVFRRGGALKPSTHRFSWPALINFLCLHNRPKLTLSLAASGKGVWTVYNEEQLKIERDSSLKGFMKNPDKNCAAYTKFRSSRRPEESGQLNWAILPKYEPQDPKTVMPKAPKVPKAKVPQAHARGTVSVDRTQPIQLELPPRPKRKALGEDPALEELEQCIADVQTHVDDLQAKRVELRKEEDDLQAKRVELRKEEQKLRDALLELEQLDGQSRLELQSLNSRCRELSRRQRPRLE